MALTTSAFIQRFVGLCSPREIFTTRDLLNYGNRNAVDQVMYRMVKTGRVIRLARGVFVRRDYDDRGHYKKEEFTALEIAKVKAQSFGRQIAIHAKDIAYKLKLLSEGNKEITFATDGGTSSFVFGNVRIHFKRTSLKNMRLADKRAGQVIRALIYIGKNMGKKLCDKTTIRRSKEIWNLPLSESEMIRTGVVTDKGEVKNLDEIGQEDKIKARGIIIEDRFIGDDSEERKKIRYPLPIREELIRSNAYMPAWLAGSFDWFENGIYKWTGKMKLVNGVIEIKM